MDLYRQLQEHIHQMSLGFPASKSGVEIKILQRLFTEEEARMHMNLALVMETAEAIAKRLSTDSKAVSELLEQMTQKGLLFKTPDAAGNAMYCATPFIIGFFENQAETLDKPLAELFDQYFKETFYDNIVSLPLKWARTLPIEKSIDTTQRVSSYDETREYIKSQDKIAISNCMCRVMKNKVSKACDVPLESCFVFGWYADYMAEIGVARKIGREEALEINDRCEDAGLVTFAANVSDPQVICHCCSCCCVQLKSLGINPDKNLFIASNYYAEVDADTCVGCETCVDRCHMHAISMDTESNVAVVKRDRCIGCGVCTSICKVEAISLQPKPAEERHEVVDTVQLMTKIGEVRGTL